MNTESKSETDREKDLYLYIRQRRSDVTLKKQQLLLYFIGVFWDIIINIDYLIELQVPVHKLSFETDATTVFG